MRAHDTMARAVSAFKTKSPVSHDWKDSDLQLRPGFLIRRLHQLHSALFSAACGHENITPVMYSVLSALAHYGPTDQTTLAKAVAIDKTNMTDILDRLKSRGLIKRRASSNDRRIRLTQLTPDGQTLLDRVNPQAEEAHHKTLEALAPEDRDAFVAMMIKIIDANDRPR